MNGRRSFWLAAVVLALAAGTGAAQPRAEAPHKPVKPIPPDGTEVFRWLLHMRGIEPLTERELMERDLNRVSFDDVIVIVIRDNDDHTDPSDPLKYCTNAIRDGGSVLIATDRYLALKQVTANVLEVNTSHIFGTKRDTLFNEDKHSPYVVPIPGPAEAGPEWQLFKGLNRIATDNPSWVVLPDPRHSVLHGLAGYPAGCRTRLGDIGEQAIDRNRDLFAIGATGPHQLNGPAFRFLLLADQSVFFNYLVCRSPDNLIFADRVVDYLHDANGQKKTKCLFIQNGHVVSSFADLGSILRAQQPPIPTPNIGELLDRLQEKLVDAGNQIVDRFEQRGGPDQIFGDAPARQNPLLRRLATILLVIASIWAVVFMLRKVWGARQPTDLPPAPPGGVPPPPRGAGAGGLFDRRQRELARRNNLYEPVRAAVHEMFIAAGAAPNAGPKLPKVVVSDVVRRADTLRDALRELWRIAFGRPAVVTAQHWRMLEPLFERVRQAHADGKWRFVVADPDAAAALVRGKEA